MRNNKNNRLSLQEKKSKTRSLLKIELTHQKKKASRWKIHKRILILKDYPNQIQLNKLINNKKAKRKLINFVMKEMKIFH